MKVPYNTGKLALVLKVMLLSFIGWNSISAQDTGEFTDSRDGNIYSWVKIGNQTWMSENLSYLPQVDTVTDGSEDIAEAKYYYVYDFAPDPDGDETTQISNATASVNYQTYGVLYNWYAAMDGEASSTSNPSGVQGVCPVGWHLPSDAEWSELETWLSVNGYGYSGPINDIGKAMADSILWEADGTPGNVGNDLLSNNSSGFSGLPAGIRSTSGLFEFIDSSIYWWTTRDEAGDFYFRKLEYNSNFLIDGFTSDYNGFSVRCVKDGPFTGVDYGLPELTSASTDWGDYDNDGDLDILLTGDNYTFWISSIYRNDNGIFTDINENLTGMVDGSAEWGDYDNDGDLDILLTGSSESGYTSHIYRNDNGVFKNINAGLTGVGHGNAEWGDYDNDGDLDILLTGQSDNGYSSYIYRNDNGIFTNINAGLTGVSYASADWSDYDNDGDLDILLTGQSDNGYSSYIYRNDNGIFTNINAGLIGVSYGSAIWGDYDNDGDLDILLTGQSDNGYSSYIYRNDNGAFTNINAGITGVRYSSAEWGDYDNDGDLDILLTGTGNIDYISYIYRNDDGAFTNINAGLTGVRHGSAKWGDYDNDGDLDILLTGQSEALFTCKIYRNNSIIPNTPPSPTSNLSIIGGGDYFTLSWDAAADIETQQEGLSYNFYLIEDGIDTIQLAPADILTGYNRLPERGKIQGTSARILNPGSGTYTWGVQSIDAGFAGSAFASTNFILGNQDPGTPISDNPQNGSTVFADSVCLKWHAVEYDNDPVYYDIYFGTEGDLQLIAESITIDTIMVKNLIPGEICYWQVTAFDEYGASTTGELWSFYVAINETEPNDQFSDAICNSNVTGFYGTVGNSTDPADYFCITYPYNGIFTITVENLNMYGIVNGGLNNVDLYNSQFSYLTNINSEYLDAGESYTSQAIMLNADETYYIKIAPELIYDNVPYRLSFSIDTFSISDFPEPNNNMQTAYQLYRDSIYSYTGYWGDDTDWYKLSFTETGTFKIRITDPNDSYTIFQGLGDVIIYNEGGTEVTGIYDYIENGGSRESGLIAVSGGQTYYIYIRPNNYGSGAAYILEIISDVQEILDGWMPTVPEPVNIVDGSVEIIPGDTTIMWTSTHPEGESLYYDLYLGNTYTPALVADGLIINEWDITGLELRDTVYWQVTAYDQSGNECTSPVYKFRVLREGYFTDSRDGNQYGYLTIGDQTWMTENLAYLPAVSPVSEGSELAGYENSSFYYVYDYNGTNVTEAKATNNYQTYGVLYNWYAAMNGESSSNTNPSNVQGVCPDGWHLPSSSEWDEFRDWLTVNGYGYDGSGDDIAKALAATTGWQQNDNYGAIGNNQILNNSSGFSAFPAGYRYYDYWGGNTNYTEISRQTLYWNCTENDIDNNRAWYWYLSSWDQYLGQDNGYYKHNGSSVRCISDIDNPLPSSSLIISGNASFGNTEVNSGNITKNIYVMNISSDTLSIDSIPQLQQPFERTVTLAPISPGDTLEINITLDTDNPANTYLDTLIIYIGNQQTKIEISATLIITINETEPNNQFSDSNCSNNETIFIGTVGNNTDPADYFCITYPYNGIFNITVENLNMYGLVNGGLNSVDIYNYQHTWITSIDESNLDAGESYTSQTIMLNADETYYIKITPELIDDNVPYRLSFSVDTFSISDFPEPNNSMQTAYPLYRDSIYSYTGYWGDDTDWYRLSFTGTGTFRIRITDPNDSYTIFQGLGNIIIYNVSGTQVTGIYSYIENGGFRETGLIAVTTGQTYYISVSPNNYGSGAAYILKIISDVQEIRDGWVPTVPEPVNIVDGSVEITPGDTTIIWNSAHPEGESLYYDLYLGNTDTPPLVADGLIINEWDITGLELRDTVYWQVTAYDQSGNESDSPVYKFRVLREGYFTDSRDGNKYGYLTIGDQTWMTENLAYLPAVSPVSDGSENTGYENSAFYYVYNFNGTDIEGAKASDYYLKYGVLYNWYAAMNGESGSKTNPSNVQGVCPDGWHLPSSSEWDELQTWLTDNGYGYEGSGSDIGKAMASASGWQQNDNPGNIGCDQASNNSSGFSAMPAGWRYFDEWEQSAYFYEISNNTLYWNSTENEDDNNRAWCRYLNSYNKHLIQENWYYKHTGSSVRCISNIDYLSYLDILGDASFGYTLINTGSITKNIYIINIGSGQLNIDSIPQLQQPFERTVTIAPISSGDSLEVNITLNTDNPVNTYLDTLKIYIASQETRVAVSARLVDNKPVTLIPGSPSHNAYDIDTIGTKLTWSGSDYEGEAITYDVYFGTTASPPIFSAALSDTFCILPVLSSETVYYWYVVAKDTYGNITISNTRFFTSWTNDPPSLTILYPDQNSLDIITDLYLKWSAYDDENDEITFDLYLGPSSSPVLIKSGYTDTTYNVTGLNKNTKYYWKVIAKDSYGNVEESQLLWFTTTNKATGWINLKVTDPDNSALIDVHYSAGTDNPLEGYTDADGYTGQIMLLTGTNQITFIKPGYFSYFTNDIEILQDQLTTANIILPHLGDYNSDDKIDQTDIDSLIINWRDKDHTYELGPATGIPPDYLIAPDGVLDFEDLMIFGMMWDYNNNPTKSISYINPSDDMSSHSYNNTNIVCSLVEDDKSGKILLNFKLNANNNILSNKLVIRYDNSVLRYEGYNDLLAGKYNGISFINNHPEEGYLELYTGILDDNIIEGIQDLASVSYTKTGVNYITPHATYEIHSVNSTKEIGIVKFDITDHINIYPNPANDRVTVEIKDTDIPSILKIISSNGRLLSEKNLLSTIENIDITGLKSGMYIFRIVTGNRVISKIIIKE